MKSSREKERVPNVEEQVDRGREKHMKKKVIILILGAMLLAVGFAAEAQQPTKVSRIGFVSGIGDPSTPGANVEGFRRGLMVSV